MEKLVQRQDYMPFHFSGAGVEPSYQESREPLEGEAKTHYYYEGISGLANYIYDFIVRILKFFICTCRTPFPEWSWKTQEIIKDEVIILRDPSKQHLTENVFFTHVLESVTKPLNTGCGETDSKSLGKDLIRTDRTTTEQIVVRRHFYDDFMWKVEILTATGTRNTDLLVSFERDPLELRERQRGVYIQEHIRRPKALWVSHTDRAAFKREVVSQAVSQAKIHLICGSTGHPDEALLTFLEESVFHASKNGCTSIYVNPQSRDIECRCTLTLENFDRMQEAVKSFNEKQQRPTGVRGSGCRAELTRFITDDRTIADAVLMIKSVSVPAS